MSSHRPTTRAEWLQRLFPAGVPRLWCPPITHVKAARSPDPERIRQHQQFLAPHVGGLLVPGSTGEGWNMTDAEVLTVLGTTLDAIQGRDTRVLVGVLKTALPEMLACLQSVQAFLCNRVGESDPLTAMLRANVVGYTVCPPKGADVTQAEMEASLSTILELGLPIALYQLPQVTENEMAPDTVARLAAKYPNFILFKDTSGRDIVANAKLDLDGMFLVRGAEGDYLYTSKVAGGVYDGYLLSSANGLARELALIGNQCSEGRRLDAVVSNRRVVEVIRRTFSRVEGFPAGNTFANANKLIDHVMAHGPQAATLPPLTFDGTPLPAEAIRDVMDYLDDNDLLPTRGYLRTNDD